MYALHKENYRLLWSDKKTLEKMKQQLNIVVKNL